MSNPYPTLQGNEMTKREAKIVAAYTGYLIGDFHEMHEYIEQVMGRPIWTHQMASEEIQAEIREKVKPDFLALCNSLTE